MYRGQTSMGRVQDGTEPLKDQKIASAMAPSKASSTVVGKPTKASKPKRLGHCSYLAKVLKTVFICYVTLLSLLLLFPSVLQPFAIYLHWVNWPVLSRKTPQSYGFRYDVLRELRIPLQSQVSQQNISLGAWHILPPTMNNAPIPYDTKTHKAFKAIEAETQNQRNARFDKALERATRVFLYFHGNAGNRGSFNRPVMYKLMTRLQGFTANTGETQSSHVISVDYRGFGDSTPTIPTEAGLQEDAIATFEYLVNVKKVSPQKIILVGHSLGSGVATFLAQTMSMRKQKSKKGGVDWTPGGLMLLAAYASIPDAAMGYPIVPLLKPFSFHALTTYYVKKFVNEKWDSESNMRNVTCPILLMHGSRDIEIPLWQTKALFVSALAGRQERRIQESSSSSHNAKVSREEREEPVVRILPQEGELWLADSVWLLDVLYGGHNSLPSFPLVKDTIEAWLQYNRL